MMSTRHTAESTTRSTTANASPRRRRRFVGAAALAALALAATSLAVDASPEAAGSGFEIAESDGSVQLSMKVRPGEPVPLEVVTREARKDFGKRGGTGAGIDVAIIDSGVAPVRGLDQPGKLVYGPDLSYEGALPNLANLDTFGHGTHLAGIIAGDDGAEVVGVAPDSRLVSVKVAGATGETNVAQIIAAIDWVIEHRNDNGLNIRVLNLSLGLDGVPSNAGDPLSAAVERAWAAGIVVVAAAGNRGNHTDGLDSPAVSPYVIAVGGTERYDSKGKKEKVAAWSSGGNQFRHPDFVAAGRSIQSFRVPGSALDQAYPSARVGERYFVGTGTSQSAAVVSGYVAALLSIDPSLTADEVKYLLEKKAKETSKRAGERVEGEGKIRPKDTLKALKDRNKARPQNHPRAFPEFAPLELVDPNGASWSGGGWNGASWSGGTWSGASWSGASWSGASWSSGVWSGVSWSGASWSGASWSGASWSGASWSGVSWSGASWSGASWSSLDWSAVAWS